MNYKTPKGIFIEDVYFGVCVANRDIIIPVTACRLPAIRYVSADIVIPIGQYAEISVPKTCEGDISFGISLGGPVINDVSIVKEAVVEFSVGMGIDTIGSRIFVPKAEMNIALNVEPMVTQGHLAKADVAHDLISTAFITRASVAPEIKIGLGVGHGINAIAINSTDDIRFGVGIGASVEPGKVRKRKLSDLEEATLADLNDVTLQELYWIDDQ